MGVSEPDDDVATQVYCVDCGKQHYLPAVAAISRGETGCGWCGHHPGVLTREAYREAVRAARAGR